MTADEQTKEGVAMPKRSNRRAANGAGNLRKRPDGTWEGRYIVGINPATGKYIRKSVYAKTQAECRKKLAAAIAAVDNGTYTDPEKMTVKQWFTVWMETYCGHLAPRTRDMYAGFLNNRILPALGAVKLDKLNAPTVQAFYNQLAGELAPKTVKNIHGIVHKALKQAQELGYIARNPAENVTLPRIEKKQIQPLSGAEMTKFLAASQDSPFNAFYQTALFTGMRLGELRGLTWDRVDFAAGSILIDRQLQIINHVHTFTPPKHNKIRTIYPAPYVMQLLRKHRTHQLEQRMQAADVWDDTGYVFTNEIGRYLLGDNVYKHFKRLCEQIGRPDTRFHDLRHTYAVNSLKAGDDPKTLSENLGHHSVAFTLDTYAFALDEMKKTSAARMEAFIQGIV